VDLRTRSSVDEVYRQISMYLSPPDIVIHAAGTSKWGLIQDFSDHDYELLMDVHVRGAFYLAQIALPRMIRKKDGRIILVSSIWGQTGGAGEVLYSAAKGAQISMAKALAKEVAPSGITVNAIAPGAIDTPLLDRQLPGRKRSIRWRRTFRPAVWEVRRKWHRWPLFYVFPKLPISPGKSLPSMAVGIHKKKSFDSY
jgi:3-oxoacyl-[acyl-carrier protein] reductase